ncbi:acetate--CoA ligase family protein [Rhodobacterales bacterium]|nr:acetate--CoA ligase family protein [Rhodobacterales bacterium]
MRSLERLLRPKTIAVAGGGAWCTNVLRECRKFGFKGDLWAVHPTRQEVAGCTAYPSVRDLPGVPDAVFIGVNRHATVEIVRDLAAMDAGGAVCFASGFREAIAELADGGELQDALVEAAGAMPVLGPNCYGFINAASGAALWPDQHGLRPVERGVAIISQSSNIALNMTMQTRGLPIACLMTAGNQAQSGLSAMGEALLADERITAIGLHVEGIDDLEAFERFALAARRCGKPVAVLKVGKSEQAQAATISHTASLAGSSAGAEALFKRLGIAQVHSLPTLLETLKILHLTGGIKDTRLASMSCSGGEASLIADTAHGTGISFPALTERQKTDLGEVLGAKVALANPLDYHTYIWGDGDATTRVFTHMMEGDASLGLVILDFPRSDCCDPGDWLDVISAVEAAGAASGKQMAVLSSLGETLPESVAIDLMARGILPLCGFQEAIDAITAAASVSGPVPVARILRKTAALNPVTLSEHASKAALEEFGLRIPKSRTAATPDEAEDAATEIGFPVVLKGTGLAHKSEAGAVALGLKSCEEVRVAAEAMTTAGYLVEEMVSDAAAELLIGAVRDPAHGFILTLAAGGVLTELLADRVSLLVPATRDEVATALSQLRIARLLDGYRGKPACAIEPIVDAVMAVQAYVTETAVEEVEINPLLCGSNFAIAADALIRCGEQDDR